MWSDQFYYLNIYKDEHLSEDIDLSVLQAFLDSLPGIVKVDDHNYNCSYLSITLLFAKSNQAWSSLDIDNKKVNLLSIICRKNKEINFEEQKETLIKIASFLNWQLVDEESDDGIENFVIWAPK